MERDEAISRIRKALRRRSGRPWSVTGGRGTAWGWIRIDAPPKRRTFDWTGELEGEGRNMGLRDRVGLALLLGLDRAIHEQGEGIPSGDHYREEYVDRAEGRKPERCGVQYWD